MKAKEIINIIAVVLTFLSCVSLAGYSLAMVIYALPMKWYWFIFATMVVSWLITIMTKD